MAKRIKIKTDSDDFVHFDFMKNCLTLCGLETTGDPSLHIESGIITQNKVNCPDCLAIVIFCKSIKAKEFIKK